MQAAVFPPHVPVYMLSKPGSWPLKVGLALHLVELANTEGRIGVIAKASIPSAELVAKSCAVMIDAVSVDTEKQRVKLGRVGAQQWLPVDIIVAQKAV